ncbi:MAG: TonB-dependent receptor [Bacteroidota bacterium]
MYYIRFSLFLVFVLSASSIRAQTVTGIIIDTDTKEPLIGANIVLVNHQPLIGTSSNTEGHFELQGLPVGRQSFRITYLGYRQRVVSEVLVVQGKETFLTVELTEEVFAGAEVNVVADIPTEEPVNGITYASAKAFTVEETRRYAGGLDDPARLVTAFAGVTSSGGTQSNAISIRGNAPKSVQWRLHGIEIPNPNHFAGLTVAGGGGLTLFSAQLLSKSDFMTGAFPAEYGNALSGVFDINFRTAKPGKRELTTQIGLNGIEVASGGSILPGSEATYLVNYRYSTLALLMPLLPTDGFIGYQDLSFNLDIPTEKVGRFNLWGIGGLDRQTLEAKSDTAQWEYAYWDFSDNEIRLGVGAVGVSHSLLVNKGGYLKTTVAWSGNSTRYTEDQLDTERNSNPNLRIRNNTSRLALKSYLHQKLNKRVHVRSGVEVQRLFYDLDLSGRPDNVQPITRLVDGNGDADLIQTYVLSEYHLLPSVSLVGGIHTQWFSVNDEFLAEPRASIKIKINPASEFTLGYGLHSQIEDLSVYFAQQGGERPNERLQMAKSHHLVAGYRRNLGQNHMFNIEVFDQVLFDVPVIADSSFSMLNFLQDFNFNEALVNDGQGRNTGLEVTLERYLSDGYYYLLTTTLYSSRYRGGDKVWRNTRFNQNVVANALIGKEIIRDEGARVFGANFRGTFSGGERYTPIDLPSSVQAQRVREDGVQAFTNQFSARFIADVSFYLRKRHRNVSTEWSLMVKNVFLAQDYTFDYNFRTEQVDRIREGTILPILSWKVEF